MAEASDKTEKVPAPSVAIDGLRIRNVREGKKLTQLYVASVVGVTTDTISRWENNRYPTIKRENAQKLADALEVPLEEILRPEQPPTEEAALQPEAVPPVASGRRLLFVAGFTAMLLLLGVTIFFTRRTTYGDTAVRWTPRFAAPGEVIPVRIKVVRSSDNPFGFILKERLPSAARLVSSIPPSSSASSIGEAKWLVPSGGTPVTVSYSVQVPPLHTPGSDLRLKGEIVLHGGDSNRTEAVGGTNEIRIGAYHWADANGDGRIDDDEIMPAYYICEEMKGLGLDWKTIEAIWTGKGYRWDAKSGYTVIK